MDATEFEQRSREILGRMDKSLAKIETRRRVPVSIHTRDRMVFPVDLSLRVCLPLLSLLSVVAAWNVVPIAVVPALGLSAVALDYALSARFAITNRVSHLLIKAIGRAVPATVLEMAHANSDAKSSSTPMPIIRAANRYLDPNKANMMTPDLDTPTLDHTRAIERALYNYGLLASGHAKETLVIEELKKAGIIVEAQALISRERLSTGVALIHDPVSPAQDDHQTPPTPSRRF